MNEKYDWENKPVKLLRDQVIEQLSSNYTQFNLEINEFEERLAVAHETNDRQELMSLTKDLPNIEPSAIDTQKKYDTVTSIFFANRRTGRWVPPKQLDITSIFGGIYVDFRNAELKSQKITVNLTNIFGVTTIIVPPDVNVVLKKVNIMGGIFGKSTQDPIPGAPTIEIQGTSIFGGAKVSIKRAKYRLKS